MTAMEAIRSRRSVRSFDGRTLPEEVLAELKRFADSVENPYELPIVWKILDGRARDLTSPVIIGTDTWIAGKMRRAPHAEEAFGFAFERVVLYAAARGIGTTWIAGTMDRPAFERAMGLKKGEVMPCVSPLGYPAAKMSLRETVMRKTIKADSRLPFEQLFFAGGFDKPLTAEEAGRLALPLELAARYGTRVMVEENINGRELECAVRSAPDGPKASGVGEILSAAGTDFYDFDAKYSNPDSRTDVAPVLPEGKAEEIRRAAVKVFEAVGAYGLSRVDFFLENGTNRVIFNEINTFPGFTNISMYPQLWAAAGLPIPKLLDALIEEGLRRGA